MVAVVNNPHYREPFSFAPGGCPIVEQDSKTDVQQCAVAALRTELGTRTGLPTFGLKDQAMLMGGANLSEIKAAVAEHEPRLDTHPERDHILRDAVDTVRVDLTGGEESN